MKELLFLREYERATRDTVCFGMRCIHEAWALEMISKNEAEMEWLKREVKRLRIALGEEKSEDSDPDDIGF